MNIFLNEKNIIIFCTKQWIENEIEAIEEKWFHFQCFFNAYQPKSINDIAHFKNLSSENQKKVFDKIKVAYDPTLQVEPSNSTKRRASTDLAGSAAKQPRKERQHKAIVKIDDLQRIKLKNGTIVEPKSGLVETANVYRQPNSNILYSVVLSNVDIQRNQNEYIKMQLLQADKGNNFWVFRVWGRIGTDISQKSTSPYNSVIKAINAFVHYFQLHTGNLWGQPFNKLPGKFSVVEVLAEVSQFKIASPSPSNLSDEIQDLVKMICNTNPMNQTMTIEFKLDIWKMPLGPLSTNQLLEAQKCFDQLEQFINDGTDRATLIAASNNFFSLVPHNFGLNKPPVIETVS